MAEPTDRPGGQRGKPAHIRLPDELHAAVKQYAADSSRSITNAIVYLVGVGLDAENARHTNPKETEQ